MNILFIRKQVIQTAKMSCFRVDFRGIVNACWSIWRSCDSTNLGASDNFGLFCHIFALIFKYNHLRIILLPCWVLCDVSKTLFEAIEVLWMLAGPSRCLAMVRKLGAVGDFGLFCHIFALICYYNRLRSILLTCWVLLSMPYI